LSSRPPRTPALADGERSPVTVSFCCAGRLLTVTLVTSLLFNPGANNSNHLRPFGSYRRVLRERGLRRFICHRDGERPITDLSTRSQRSERDWLATHLWRVSSSRRVSMSKP